MCVIQNKRFTLAAIFLTIATLKSDFIHGKVDY